MSERTETEAMTAAADLPVDYEIGHPEYLRSRKDILIHEQRAKRMLLKNARRVKAGLPPIAKYSDL